MMLASLAIYCVRLQLSVKRRPASRTICTCRGDDFTNPADFGQSSVIEDADHKENAVPGFR